MKILSGCPPFSDYPAQDRFLPIKTLARLRLKPITIKRQVFHRKGAKNAEMIHFFFAAERTAKKNAHALWARPSL